jgi:hypothetical protein
MGSLFIYSSTFFGSHTYRPGWVEGEARDNLIFSLPVFFLICILYTSLVVCKALPMIKFLGILLVTLVDWVLWKTGIIQIHKPWVVWCFPIVNFLIMLMVSWMYHALSPRTQKKPQA